MFGARAVQRSIVERFPQVEISVSIVWINMLEGDDEVAAKRSAQIIRDPRVRHFHDPHRLAGKEIAKGLLMEGAGPAWDIYLFYRPGDKWTAGPPRPSDWMHQLGGGQRADPTRYRWGDHLVNALFQTTERLVG